jgi:hypothetical protein
MKSDGMFRKLPMVFAIALALYAAAYFSIEHRRKRNGPWQVTFMNDVSTRSPALLIDQPALGITNLQIVFPGALVSRDDFTNTLAFDHVRAVPYDLPFGQCIFMDTTFLPGTVVFKIFDHEIQLIPRILTVDKKEHPWKSHMTLSLPATTTNSLPAAR